MMHSFIYNPEYIFRVSVGP